MKRHPTEPFWRITAKEARAMIEEGGVQVVHLEDAQDQDSPHIPGAICISFAWVTECLAELDAGMPLIIACAVGTRSAFGAEVGCSLGKGKVYHLEGGVAAWIEAGYLVEKGHPEETAPAEAGTGFTGACGNS